MTDQKWAALAKKIEPSWGEERDRAARVGLDHRAATRRVTTGVLASVAALALVAGAAEAFVHWRTHEVTSTASLAPSAAPLGGAVETVTVTRL
ncbi:MAG TPA: hypothetical protein VGL19_10760, partial [Polyangiaceae bacterium]